MAIGCSNNFVRLRGRCEHGIEVKEKLVKEGGCLPPRVECQYKFVLEEDEKCFK